MQRVIILGASNVTLAFPTIVQKLRSRLGPVELLAAHGHGRSYGMGSRVLCRGLPSIRSCQLWEDLAERPTSTQRPLALITDVGNDLLYGASVEQILQWVDTCLERLAGMSSRLAVATLPMGSVRKLGRIRYQLTKAFFFPGSGPDWQSIQAAAVELDAGLCRLAGMRGAALITPRPEWYGFDPIHIRRSERVAAWTELLGVWPDVNAMEGKPADSRITSTTLWRLRPAVRTLCGRRQECRQPVARLSDGTTISVY
jgi:hypothetical protein